MPVRQDSYKTETDLTLQKMKQLLATSEILTILARYEMEVHMTFEVSLTEPAINCQKNDEENNFCPLQYHHYYLL